MAVFESNVTVRTSHGASDYSNGPNNPHTNGGGVYQVLLSSGAYSVKVDKDQDITIKGSLLTETGGAFVRHIGDGLLASAYSSKEGSHNPSSIVEVDGITTDLYKKKVVEVFNVNQTNKQPNFLTYTMNGLQIYQYSPHIFNVTGTNTRLIAGHITEDIEVVNNRTIVSQGSAYSEQYTGFALKVITGANFDLFTWMRSEFVQMFQFNIGLGWTLIVHIVLKVLQIFGSAAGVMEIKWKSLKEKMELLETNIHACRARFHQFSARGGILLLGLWRILF